MLEGWLAAGEPIDRFTVIRPSGKPAPGGVRTLTAPPADEPPPAILLLGFKPHQLADLAPTLSRSAGAATTIVSILAGVDLATLHGRFPGTGGVVRAMPNLPVRLGQGVVGLVGAHAPPVDGLMAKLGHAPRLVDEGALDAVSALAGSGPAFVYRFIDALAAGGAALGLDPRAAAELALATVAGSAALAARSDVAPSVLADRVASKGGSTRRGLDVLDQEGALVSLIEATLVATRGRVAEMAAEARRAAD